VKKLKRFDHLDPFENNLFTCLNYTEARVDLPKRDFIQIAAFDPGVVNTGCRIEKRFIKDGKDIVVTVKQLLLKSGDRKNESHYFMVMKEHLMKIAADLYECDYILIESQLKANPEAIRMGQHIVSTILSIIEESRALMIEILPTVKSKAFGIKGLKGKELKHRAVEESLKLLSERGDVIGESLIKESRKKDDMADVVLYCDAWHRFLQEKKFNAREESETFCVISSEDVVDKSVVKNPRKKIIRKHITTLITKKRTKKL
jgi:hypothetical protein